MQHPPFIYQVFTLLLVTGPDSDADLKAGSVYI